jgi:hypothetical protein
MIGADAVPDSYSFSVPVNVAPERSTTRSPGRSRSRLTRSRVRKAPPEEVPEARSEPPGET